MLQTAFGDPSTLTAVDLGLLLLRLIVGGTLIAHGIAKLGWLPNTSLRGAAQELRDDGFAGGAVIAAIVGLSQAASGAAIVAGFLTPVAGLVALGVMAVAVIVKRSGGYWAHLGGVEYAFILGLLVIVVIVTGPGSLSIDRALGLDALAAPWVTVASIVVGLVGAVGAYVALHRPNREPSTTDRT